MSDMRKRGFFDPKGTSFFAFIVAASQPPAVWFWILCIVFFVLAPLWGKP